MTRMKLNYEAYGKGKPVIILHGLFGSLDNWHSFAEHLGEYFRVFVIDQRNHGRSPHADEFSYEMTAEDLKEFMLEQNLESSSLIGHSMGGKTAMQFSFTYPEKVDNLIVVDISPKRNNARYKEVTDAIKALTAVDLKNIATLREADEQMMPHVKDFAVRQFLLKNLVRAKNGKFTWKVNLSAISKNYDKIVGGVRGRPFNRPCVFIRGEHSDYVLDKDWPEIKKYFPHAELVTIPKAGHWVHIDAPHIFKTIVLGSLIS